MHSYSHLSSSSFIAGSSPSSRSASSKGSSTSSCISGLWHGSLDILQLSTSRGTTQTAPSWTPQIDHVKKYIFCTEYTATKIVGKTNLIYRVRVSFWWILRLILPPFILFLTLGSFHTSRTYQMVTGDTRIFLLFF